MTAGPALSYLSAGSWLVLFAGTTLWVCELYRSYRPRISVTEHAKTQQTYSLLLLCVFFLVSSARELVSTLTPGLSPRLHLFTQKSSSHRRFQNVFLFSLPPALCVRSDRKLPEQFAVATSRSLRSG